MLDYEFMRSAFLAGTPIALACGLVGYFVVLRAQVFAGDALSHVAFAGALGAAAAGIDVRLGLFTATVVIAIGMGELGDRARADDVVIGSVFAWILGLGALFLSIFTSNASGTTTGTAGVRVLFGSIFGLSAGEARLAAGIAFGACVAVLAIARPLLFTSLDPDVAAARGLPVRALGLGFLAILGVVAAEATQAVGALLLLGLLAAPAGAARFLTNRPYAGLVLSGALSVASMWIGLTLSYTIGSLPPSSAVVGTAVAVYAAAAARARMAAPAADQP
jgi:zinc/manganese transport system permease protein